jgi:hypothetical protein
LDEFEGTLDAQQRSAFRLLYKLISKVPYQGMVASTGGLGTGAVGASVVGSGGLMPNALMFRLGEIFDAGTPSTSIRRAPPNVPTS